MMQTRFHRLLARASVSLFTVLLAAMAATAISAQEKSALSRNSGLGFGERVSVGPTMFMFHNRPCINQVCSLGEYQLVARKSDEKVLWRVPEGKVLLRAYEVDAQALLVLVGDPAKMFTTVDRTNIRFARVDLKTGALQPTPYRYIVEARLPGIRTQYMGMHASETEKHANGNPVGTRRELVDVAGTVLAATGPQKDNEIRANIDDACYHASVLWQFGLLGEVDGAWSEIRLSGAPLAMLAANANTDAVKRWCDDARGRVLATRDRSGTWTARFPETMEALSAQRFASAEAAIEGAQAALTTRLARANAALVADAWMSRATVLNTEWTVERARLSKLDYEARRPEREAMEAKIAAAKTERERQTQVAEVRLKEQQAQTVRTEQTAVDTSERDALNAKRHRCSNPSSANLSAAQLEACSALIRRVQQSHEWQTWVWVNRQQFVMMKLPQPIEDAMRASKFGEKDLLAALINIYCLEPSDVPAPETAGSARSGMTALVEWTAARHRACGHLTPGAASECYCTFDPRYEYVAGQCRAKQLQARTGPTADEIRAERRFQACSKQVTEHTARFRP